MSERIHTVTAGQTLSRIAALYGATVQAIAQANGISNPNLIYIGQRLRIPGAAGPTVDFHQHSQQHGAPPPLPQTNAQAAVDAARRAAEDAEKKKKEAEQQTQLLLIGGAAFVVVLFLATR